MTEEIKKRYDFHNSLTEEEKIYSSLLYAHKYKKVDISNVLLKHKNTAFRMPNKIIEKWGINNPYLEETLLQNT